MDNNGYKDQAALLSKYFLDQYPLDLFSGEHSPANKHEELAQKYFTLVMEIFAVFDRLCKYEKYFSVFIPPNESGISTSEAIEYHLRNYIQEFYILRERIHKTVDSLVGDLKHYHIQNPQDVEKALNHLKKNVDTNFKEINDKLRRTHVHDRSISDYNLTRGKFFSQLLSGEMPIPQDIQLDMEKVKELYKTITESSKNKYIKQAIHNTNGLKKGKQFFTARFGYIFAELNGHDGSTFNMNAHELLS
jgi:hypothetical protein